MQEIYIYMEWLCQMLEEENMNISEAQENWLIATVSFIWLFECKCDIYHLFTWGNSNK